MNATNLRITFILLLTSITLDATAQNGLTNVDLTVGYCLRLTQLGLEKTKVTDFPDDPAAVKLFHEAQEQGENRVKQLRQFLTARAIPLDRKELVAAMQTANADLAAAYAQAEKCTKSVDTAAPGWRNEMATCSSDFAGASRMMVCREIEGLPK